MDATSRCGLRCIPPRGVAHNHYSRRQNKCAVGKEDWSPREARNLRAMIEELARLDYGGLAFERV